MIQIAPLAGFALGVNYWNSEMDNDYEKPKWHSFQILFGVIAIVITWATDIPEDNE